MDDLLLSDDNYITRTEAFEALITDASPKFKRARVNTNHTNRRPIRVMANLSSILALPFRARLLTGFE
jgi:hypothetical protein